MESIAEVFLPLQTMNIKNIVVNPPISVYPIRTPIATILYKDPMFTLQKISILTPFLTIHSWDPKKGRLELSDSSEGLSLLKLQAFYECLLKSLIAHPEWSGVPKITVDELKMRFQPIVANKLITLYINDQHDGLYSYSKKWVKGVTDDLLQPGQQVRIALRFQGLMFLKNDSPVTFYRLQHQITKLYFRLPSL
jgi:hypothetical protein